MSLNFITEKLSLIAYLIANGIEIPHYCYHNNLSIAGNCRICIVELNTVMKPIVSCAANAQTAVQSNKIYYDSPLVKKSRENILEFLLLNHPLDCPICDQGGDCDLQDQSLFFGFTKRRFHKFKRIVNDKELGPVIKTVMTRCIHCTRCVRFATEIAGVEELGLLGRGGSSEIGTYINKVLTSELSGNMIDLCPVGAFTPTYAPLSAHKSNGETGAADPSSGNLLDDSEEDLFDNNFFNPHVPPGMTHIYVKREDLELVEEYSWDLENCGSFCNYSMSCCKTTGTVTYLWDSGRTEFVFMIYIRYCKNNTQCRRFSIIKDIKIYKRSELKALKVKKNHYVFVKAVPTEEQGWIATICKRTIKNIGIMVIKFFKEVWELFKDSFK
jgi:hypothetical protein